MLAWIRAWLRRAFAARDEDAIDWPAPPPPAGRDREGDR